MGANIASIHFDTAALPPAERFERWRTAVWLYDVAQPPDAPPGSFEATADAWTLGDMVLTSNRLPAVSFARSAEKIRADGADHLSFLLLSNGSWTGDLDGRLMTVGPGQVVGFDLTRPMSALGAPGYSVTVAVKRRLIEAAAPRLPNVHGAVLNGATGRLLADYMLALVGQLPAMEPTDAPAIQKATIGLIAACLTGLERQDAAPPPAVLDLRHKVRRYIDRNLASPDLTPERICRELGLSRSVLYRAFPSSGIASYIRTRRLEAVHVLLNDPVERRSIGDIAYGFGFVSDAHFSKAFRRRFGYSPRDARLGRAGEKPGGDGSEAGPLRFRQWTRTLS